MKPFNILILLFFLFSALSCDKHRAKKLSGDYYCQVERTCFGGCNPTDSIYTELFNVQSEGKDLLLFNTKYHVDNFKNGQEFIPNNYFKVTFKKDQLKMYIRTGGMGCSCEFNYACDKMK